MFDAGWKSVIRFSCKFTGMQVLEWNGAVLTGKTYEEVQGLVGQPCSEADVCVRL